MITLEQIRLLDRKVNQAVEYIDTLKGENQMLSEKLESYQKKISELEVLLSSLKDDQSEVEQGFQKALETLSGIDETEPEPEAKAAEPAGVEDDPEAEEAAPEEEDNAELDIF